MTRPDLNLTDAEDAAANKNATELAREAAYRVLVEKESRHVAIEETKRREDERKDGAETIGNEDDYLEEDLRHPEYEKLSGEKTRQLYAIAKDLKDDFEA
jgi:hypothetical protein